LFLYIPGGDVTGIVVEAIREELRENCRLMLVDEDGIAARFMPLVAPRDALAEHAIIHKIVCEKIPADTLTFEDAAAVLAGASPSTATSVSTRVKEFLHSELAGGGDEGLRRIGHYWNIRNSRSSPDATIILRQEGNRLKKSPFRPKT
jgi:hypothetical protein